MRSALKNEEYLLYYQPQNDTQTGEVIGAEALIRWHNPEKGMIAPYRFIPIAESNGFIIELGKWVLKTAIKQKHTWEAQGINIKLAINVAAKQIQDPYFVTHLQELLTQYQVTASQIVLEITEYVFLHNTNLILKTFKEIKALGVQISLDDFGTGYSSLSYLKTFPIDILKIDKAFLDDYDNTNGAIFIKTIITMAQTLKLTVVAEGVETQEQIDYLRQLNCDNYQGYICSKPVAIDKFDALL
jgi:EAL domain-containing protein (putative c-di-GMP-specific phosphodiesterase class I)